MGNATLTVGGGKNTNTSTGGYAGTWWESGAYAVSTEEMYIDGAYVWGHAASGTVNAVAGIFGSGGTLIGAASNQHNGWGNPGYGQWQGAEWSPANFVHISGSGTDLVVGVWFSGSWTIDSDGGSGGYYMVGGSSLASDWVGQPYEPFGHSGYLGQQISYYKKCAISSVDAGPFAPGQVFNVYGNSFGNGSTIVESVSLNGVNCPTWTWVNDGQLQVTVPAGATSGTVTVVTYAGTATSSGSVAVVTGYVRRTGAWADPSFVGARRTGAWTQASEVADRRTGAWVESG